MGIDLTGINPIEDKQSHSIDALKAEMRNIAKVFDDTVKSRLKNHFPELDTTDISDIMAMGIEFKRFCYSPDDHRPEEYWIFHNGKPIDGFIFTINEFS